MLTSTQQAHLWNTGYCSYHETRFNSLFEGEPFLAQGFLYYFDGRKLFLCGYPLDGERDHLRDRLLEIVEHCFREMPIEAVSYCGPERVSFATVCPRKGAAVSQAPEHFSAELVVECSEPPANRRLRTWLRSAQRNTLEIASYRGPLLLTVERLRLIESFFRVRETTPYLLDLAFALPGLTRLDGAHWFEVLQAGRLCGLALVLDAFRTMDLAVFLTTDRSVRGASDALYAAFIESAKERGKKTVNLGPSIAAGHYWYKEKWGGRPLVAPYWYWEWACGELARADFFSWPSRILQYGFRPLQKGLGVDARNGRSKRSAAQGARNQ
jgi:hypothetical protein